MSRFTYTSNIELNIIYDVEKATKIVCFVQKNDKLIIENIKELSVAVYEFIIKESQKGNVKDNLVFQHVFSTFYGLNNAGLTDSFKKLYFVVFDECIDKGIFDIKYILNRLKDEKNRRGQRNMQFSFATKMIHTLDIFKPIYDNEIARLFDFKQPYGQKDFDEKLNTYINQYEQIKFTYNKIIEKKLLENVIDMFKLRFVKYNISDYKVLDFIFWTAEKEINNKKKAN